ncbi:hypothetical protein HK405_015489 [Cladochytrium tenue]|nr:hypothetical protein HK405_015489 [Cladochytrium tenue]
MSAQPPRRSAHPSGIALQSRRGVAVDEDDAADLRFGAEFEESDDCKALMISEVKVLLELVEEKRRSEGMDAPTASSECVK